MHTLQQALDARSGLAARQAHVLIEATRAGGIGTRKRTVNPVGELRRGPPLGLGGGALVGGLHALDQIGERRELPARDGLGKRRELGCLGRNVARGQTGGELTKQLGRPGRNHEHAHGIGGSRGIVVRRDVLARLHQTLDRIHISMSTGMGAGDLHKGGPSDGLRGGLGRSSILP